MLNYQVNINEQFKSTEILFDGKPSEAVREKLKANGYRWHKVKGVWYGYKTPEELAEILNGSDEQADDVKAEIKAKTDEQKAKKQADKEEQNRLRAEFLEEIKRIDGEKWVDYYDKETARVVKFENGTLYQIEKPRIETRFCFGYGQNGISDDEDEERADNMAHYAKTQADYFIKENLKKFDDMIKTFEEHADLYYACPNRSNTKKWVFIRYYRNIGYFEDEYKDIAEKRFKLSAVDLERLKNGYEIERKNFEKRLNAYLKRYGTSKLDVWTYLVD